MRQGGRLHTERGSGPISAARVPATCPIEGSDTDTEAAYEAHTQTMTCRRRRSASGNNYGNIGYYTIVNGQRVDYSLNMPEDDPFIFASTVRVTHITINGWNFNHSC